MFSALASTPPHRCCCRRHRRRRQRKPEPLLSPHIARVAGTPLSFRAVLAAQFLARAVNASVPSLAALAVQLCRRNVVSTYSPFLCRARRSTPCCRISPSYRRRVLAVSLPCLPSKSSLLLCRRRVVGTYSPSLRRACRRTPCHRVAPCHGHARALSPSCLPFKFHRRRVSPSCRKYVLAVSLPCLPSKSSLLLCRRRVVGTYSPSHRRACRRTPCHLMAPCRGRARAFSPLCLPFKFHRRCRPSPAPAVQLNAAARVAGIQLPAPCLPLN